MKGSTATAPAATRLRDEAARTARRGLLLHDTLAFLVLAFVAVSLFGVTLVLFRSFERHREALGRAWTAEGKAALADNRPADAVAALRAGLSYSPDDRADQLLLAQALAAQGRTDEATNYFLNLWEASPGDGFLNLQLARLSRAKGDAQMAGEYYRAAIYGGWQGDGLLHRRKVRLELADYLIARGNLAGARSELLVGASNAPDDPATDLFFGDKLRSANDPQDAMTYYRKAIAADGHDRAALARAGELAYKQGDYALAHTLLARALRETSGAQNVAEEPLAEMERNAGRLLELNLSRELPARVRADHLFAASAIAQRRLMACTAATSPATPPALADLRARWKLAETPASRRALATDATTQDGRMQLIFDTEHYTERAMGSGPEGGCGLPDGDDALLLALAARQTSAGGVEP